MDQPLEIRKEIDPGKLTPFWRFRTDQGQSEHGELDFEDGFLGGFSELFLLGG